MHEAVQGGAEERCGGEEVALRHGAEAARLPSRSGPKDSQWPQGIQFITNHQMLSMLMWWYTWRNVTWWLFFRRMKKKVSMNSMSLEK